KKQIGSLGMSILQHSDYGTACLARLYRVNPHSKRMKPAAVEDVAKKMIRDDLDKIRSAWAKQWFYYGNNPQVLSAAEMSDSIERELWALWILDEQFKLNLSDLSHRFGMDPTHAHDASRDRRKYNPLGIFAVGKHFPALTDPIL